MEPHQLLEDFKRQFPGKYVLAGDEPLGSGHYGAVFRATEPARALQVAIKIHHDGLAPAGSGRGWNISSLIANPQIATTYTIEDFTASDQRACKAVVTQFIPGKALQHIWESREKIPGADLPLLADDYAFSLIPSLLEALDVCHTRGYGHGDLHDGNIMVFCGERLERFYFFVVLIDFDNASIQTEVYCTTEKDKIASDYRLLKRAIAGTLQDWQWLDLALSLHEAYDNVRLLKVAYSRLLDFIRLARNRKLGTQRILAWLTALMNSELGMGHTRPVVDAARQVAAHYGLAEAFGYAHEDFREAMKKQENWQADVEMEIIENVAQKKRAYAQIFEGQVPGE